MDFHWLGKTILLVGIVLVVAGTLIMVFPKIPFLGKLPGDISIKKGNFVLYLPITSCIIISIILTIVLVLFKR